MTALLEVKGLSRFYGALKAVDDITFSLPAGLGVYWVAGNIIGFLIQYAMNNSRTARDIREHLAKREGKRDKKLKK